MSKGKVIVDWSLVILGVCVGGTLVVVLWAYRFWRQSNMNAQRDEAVGVLRARGMEAFLYLPSSGADSEDIELNAALLTFDRTGYVVMDRTGNAVGYITPKVGPPKGLRLVVDNTK